MSDYLHSDDFLRDFACGNERAFRALHSGYFAKLTTSADKIIKNYTEAEDIAIEALSRLMIDHKRYGYGSFTLDRLKNYLYLSVRHRCFNYLSSFRRSTRASDKEADESLIDASVQSVEEAMIYAEVIARLCEVLKDLPEEKRTALDLVYYQNKKVKDAAVQMDVSLSTFKNIRERAFQDISKKVPGKEIITSMIVLFACGLRF